MLQVPGHLTLEPVSNHLRPSRKLPIERNGESVGQLDITFVLSWWQSRLTSNVASSGRAHEPMC
jgi:hypothetical protein